MAVTGRPEALCGQGSKNVDGRPPARLVRQKSVAFEDHRGAVVPAAPTARWIDQIAHSSKLELIARRGWERSPQDGVYERKRTLLAPIQVTGATPLITSAQSALPDHRTEGGCWRLNGTGQ
jgi:hypothetical protein